MTTRRAFLASAASVATAGTISVATAANPLPHPDAELIRLCAEHVVNMDTYNRDGGTLPLDVPDPLWDAYERTRDAISEAKPCTLEGMLAKA